MIQTDNGKFFQYNTIGEFIAEGIWIHPERIIKSTELIFVLDGEVHIEEDGIRHTLTANQMIILEAGKLHRGFKESFPASFYWFHFYTDIPLPFKTFTGDNYYDVKMLLKKLLHISRSPSYSPNAADAAGYLIFQELCALSSAENMQGNVLSGKIMEYIRINAAENITVNSVAEHFGYNPDYIGKLFSKSFKVGIKEFMSLEKIKLAKDLLLSTNLTVKQIAFRVGYSDENLFVKFFTYHESISPTKFRSRYFRTHINNK